MNKSLITLFCTTLFFNTMLYAKQNAFDSLITKGIDHIYNIEFEKAEIIFNQVKAEYPDHPAGQFFEAMILWWRILLDLNNEKYDNQFYDELEDVVEMCDDILDKNETDIDAYFFKGGSLGFRARLLAIRENWMDAALDGKEALPLVFDAYALDSTNVDVQLGFGIYNYYAAVIPEHYEFVKPFMIFFPEGNKEEGLKQLTLAADSGKFSKTEALYFLMTSYYRYERNYKKAHELADRLIKKYPKNPVFNRYKGRIFVRQGNYDKAKSIFESVLNKYINKAPGYNEQFAREAYYYIAQYYRAKNDIDSALVNYNNCIELSKIVDRNEESGFRINAALAKAKLLLEKGNKAEAIELFNEILDMREYRDSHSEAERYLEQLQVD